VRQWLVEHLLLFVTASALGAALAVYGAEWITQSIPVESRPYMRDYAALPVDIGVVAFALAIGALCGVVFGWFPAWSGTRADVNADLRDGSARSTRAGPARGCAAALMVCEVSLALAVLISGALIVATSRNMRRVDVGFDPRRFSPSSSGSTQERYRTPAELRGLLRAAARRARGPPGHLFRGGRLAGPVRHQRRAASSSFARERPRRRLRRRRSSG
jgi:hypothetical protein